MKNLQLNGILEESALFLKKRCNLLFVFLLKVKVFIVKTRHQLLPYHYKQKDFEGTLLSNFKKENKYAETIANKIIYCFWTGNNPLSDNRLDSLKSLKENTGCPVILITPENLEDYVISEAPLHPAFNYLSLVHKADYLRCYFMHHYGGGYADIKRYKNCWGHAFDKLNHEAKYYGVGYTEINQYTVAAQESVFSPKLKANYFLLIGNGAYIFKPRTPFTLEWYSELIKRLDTYFPLLLNAGSDETAYPIPWSGILGDIFHPLCLKYYEYLLHDKNLLPSFSNYR